MTRYGENKPKIPDPVDIEVQEFLDYWDKRGVDLPSPINYPKCFLYYVKLWKYYNRDK